MRSMMGKLEPIYPGEILKQDFINPMGLTGFAFAKAIDVPQDRVSKIVNGKRNITATPRSVWPTTSVTPRSSG
jgi:addiction module HigA family antidote